MYDSNHKACFLRGGFEVVVFLFQQGGVVFNISRLQVSALHAAMVDHL